MRLPAFMIMHKRGCQSRYCLIKELSDFLYEYFTFLYNVIYCLIVINSVGVKCAWNLLHNQGVPRLVVY
jgi:hypothetical protein